MAIRRWAHPERPSSAFRTSCVSQRAGTLLDAGRLPRHGYDFALGSPGYLVSARRQDILDRRARFTDH